MGILQTIVDDANAKAQEQTTNPLKDDNPLAGKITLTEDTEKEQMDWSELPRATIHIGALDPSVDQDDSGFGCSQNMITQVKCWLICPIADVYELILQCNRAILGLQPDTYITELILSSGFLKEINGAKCWYELSYQFNSITKSE